MDVSMHYDKKDYDGYMLMKFWEKEEYQQEFLDGKLFFNTLIILQNAIKTVEAITTKVILLL